MYSSGVRAGIDVRTLSERQQVNLEKDAVQKNVVLLIQTFLGDQPKQEHSVLFVFIEFPMVTLLCVCVV